MNNVFVLYDRATGSVWYPTSNEHLEATSGIQRGARIRFFEKPNPVPLSVWREAHPNTKVLVASAPAVRRIPPQVKGHSQDAARLSESNVCRRTRKWSGYPIRAAPDAVVTFTQ